jgi:hypothetical protein
MHLSVCLSVGPCSSINPAHVRLPCLLASCRVSGPAEYADAWAGGNAVVRLGPSLAFTGGARDFFAPADWLALDDADLDVGSTGPLLLDLPDSMPSQLVVQMGKPGAVYLLDRNNLGCAPSNASSPEPSLDTWICLWCVKHARFAVQPRVPVQVVLPVLAIRIQCVLFGVQNRACGLYCQPCIGS